MSGRAGVDEQEGRYESQAWRDWFARHPDHSVNGKCISHPMGCDRRCLEDAPVTPPRVDEQAALETLLAEGRVESAVLVKGDFTEADYDLIRWAYAVGIEHGKAVRAAELVSLKDALEEMTAAGERLAASWHEAAPSDCRDPFCVAVAAAREALGRQA